MAEFFRQCVSLRLKSPSPLCGFPEFAAATAAVRGVEPSVLSFRGCVQPPELSENNQLVLSAQEVGLRFWKSFWLREKSIVSTVLCLFCSAFPSFAWQDGEAGLKNFQKLLARFPDFAKFAARWMRRLVKRAAGDGGKILKKDR
jgi:hypothetical protein